MKFNPKWFLGLYGLLLVAALPLALRLVPPNRWYGFRIPGRLIDPEQWYDINALGGQLFAEAMGLGMVLNVILIWFAPQPMQRYINWINVSLVFLAFWLVTLKLMDALS